MLGWIGFYPGRFEPFYEFMLATCWWLWLHSYIDRNDSIFKRKIITLLVLQILYQLGGVVFLKTVEEVSFVEVNVHLICSG